MTRLRFHHVSLRVRSAANSLAFYCGVLGFAEERVLLEPDGRRIVHLAAPGSGMVLEVIEGEPGPADAVHLGFACADLDRTLEGAFAAGAEIARGPLRIGAERIAFVRDPDGYLIEFNQGLAPVPS
jgi:lactoylglutathione lyase